MQIKTEGIVIKEMNVGEGDRVITILTKKEGVMRAFARGSKRLKSPLAAPTQLFCYSDFILHEGKNSNVVNTAECKTSFYKLRDELTGLALAQYFCELMLVLGPVKEDAEGYLRLLLNAFYLMLKGGIPLQVIKSTYEMRLLAIAGYMPDMRGCCCGQENGELLFSPMEGRLYCENCKGSAAGGMLPLSPGVLTALRHVLYSELSKAFFFTLKEESLIQLEKTAEHFLTEQLERRFVTLDFYHSVV